MLRILTKTRGICKQFGMAEELPAKKLKQLQSKQPHLTLSKIVLQQNTVFCINL